MIIPSYTGLNTLGTGDADLRFYRVLQSFVSFVTTSRRVTQICVFYTRLDSTHSTLNYTILGSFLRIANGTSHRINGVKNFEKKITGPQSVKLDRERERERERDRQTERRRGGVANSSRINRRKWLLI
jgi:hypothetical protein